MTTPQKIRSFFLMAIAALGITACATTSERMDSLQQTLTGFEKAIRWAQFDAANGFRQWPMGKQPPLPDYYKNIRVTSYKPMNLQFGPEKMSATQIVEVRYYNTDSSRVRTLRHEQKWEYSKENKRWYLVSELPKF
jgi:hypothetical protein